VKNIIIMCLINSLAQQVAKELCAEINYNYIDLTEILEEIQINSKTELNIVAQNLEFAKMSSEQLKIISNAKQTVFVCNNFNLLSEKFLNSLKEVCTTIYIEVDKNEYLEYRWKNNLDKPSKFKVETSVFEFRQKAYISCVDECIKFNGNIKALSKKLIKKLENL